MLDSLIKLSSTKNFGMHEQVKNVLNGFSKSFDIELCQRSLCNFIFILESKKLARYNAALRLNNKLSFDEDLEFLSGFVETAKRNGAKEYKKMFIAGEIRNELKFTPHETKKVQAAFPFQK